MYKDKYLKAVQDLFDFEKSITIDIDGKKALQFDADSYEKWKELNEIVKKAAEEESE